MGGVAGGRTRNTVRYQFGRLGGRVEVMGWGRVGRVVVVVEGLGRVEEAWWGGWWWVGSEGGWIGWWRWRWR